MHGTRARRTIAGLVGGLLSVTVFGTPDAPHARAEGLAGFDFDPFWMWTDVAAGDLDGDGRDDLCGVQVRIDDSPPHTSRIVRFLQDAARPGHFRRLPSIRTGDDVWRVRLADLDGDGRLDVVTADTGTVTVALLHDDGPDVRSYRVNGWVEAIAVGDVDGDGRPDILASPAGGTVALLQDPSAPGAFRAAETIGPPSSACVVGEFAGGTLPDVALVSLDHGLRVLSDRAAGAWTGTSLRPSRRRRQAVALGDIDSDGRDELLHLSGPRSGRLRVSAWIGAPDGDAAPVTSWTRSGASWVAVADFDRDGRADIVLGGSSGVSWMRQRADASGVFTRGALRGVGRFLGAGSVGDFDADGLPDVAVAGRAVMIVRQDAAHPGRFRAARRIAAAR